MVSDKTNKAVTKYRFMVLPIERVRSSVTLRQRTAEPLRSEQRDSGAQNEQFFTRFRATIKANATAVVRNPMASPNKGRGGIPVFSRESPRILEKVTRLSAKIEFEGDVVILRNPHTEANTHHAI